MTALICALLLAVMSSSQPNGAVFVHMTPGMQVLIDGVAAGVTTSEEGGKLVKGVTPGPHRVIVRSEDGRQATVNVTVSERETTDVNISPLGFRKLNRPAEDENSTVRVVSIPMDSVVEFHGVVRENQDATELTYDAIPAGKFPLLIMRNGKTTKADIDVPKASVVTVDVNSKTGVFHVIDVRPKPRRMQVTEANDALTRLDVPAHWKTAVRSALPATVMVLDATARANGLTVALKVPSDDMGEALLYSLASSSSFSSVTYASRPHREQTGWVVAFNFTFPTLR